MSKKRRSAHAQYRTVSTLATSFRSSATQHSPVQIRFDHPELCFPESSMPIPLPPGSPRSPMSQAPKRTARSTIAPLASVCSQRIACPLSSGFFLIPFCSLSTKVSKLKRDIGRVEFEDSHLFRMQTYRFTYTCALSSCRDVSACSITLVSERRTPNRGRVMGTVSFGFEGARMCLGSLVCPDLNIDRVQSYR